MCREDTLYGDNDKVRQMYSAKYSFFRGINDLEFKCKSSLWVFGERGISTMSIPKQEIYQNGENAKKKLYEFVSTLSVRRFVFNNFLLINATADRRKSSSNHHRIFFDVSSYTPFQDSRTLSLRVTLWMRRYWD